MTDSSVRPRTAEQSASLEKAWAGRRLTKTERLARELVERLETIPQPLLAALLITLLDEAERRKRMSR